jgi:hypothetical protein
VERHPDQPISSSADDPGRTGATVLSFAGAIVAVMQIDMPLPDGWQAAVQRAVRYWPEAEAVFKRHRAHLVVGVGESEDRLHVARVIAAVAGAVAAACPACTGMLWALTVANSSKAVTEQSRSAFAPYPDFPTSLWVSMHPFRISEPLGVGVVTMGLKNFIGREIELDGQASQFKSVVTTAHGLATYLLQHGAKVRDGDTIGASENERILVRLVDSRRFNGLPVIAASLPAE